MCRADNSTAEDSGLLRCSAVAIGKTTLLGLCDSQDGGFTMLKSNYLPTNTALTSQKALNLESVIRGLEL